MNAVATQDLCDVFLANVRTIPKGNKIDQCLQCGTCSASCPVSEAMDYSPREIIAALRARMLDRVLRSNTVWLCCSCYSCTVRCPAGIPFTDVMYELKRLGVKYDSHTQGAASAIMAQAFVKSVDRHGRNHEPELMRSFYLHTKPARVLGLMRLVLKLFARGRIHFRPHNIRGRDSLRKMMAAVEESGPK
jgi:heterodisulfide reductase subunit C